MANFGARLAYPIPDRIVAHRSRQHELTAREALDRPSALELTFTRVVLALLGMHARPHDLDEHPVPIAPNAPVGTRRVA